MGSPWKASAKPRSYSVVAAVVVRPPSVHERPTADATTAACAMSMAAATGPPPTVTPGNSRCAGAPDRMLLLTELANTMRKNAETPIRRAPVHTREALSV